MMTSEIIPKEKFSAYQRWEMDSLETLDSIRQEPKVDLVPENNGQEDGRDQIKWPTEEEIAAVFQDAKETGYAAGYQAGNTAGYAEGRQAAEVEVQTEVNRMHALLSSLDEDLHQMDQQVAGGLLDLAIALAQKMITQALIIKPELII
ncbi:MAG: FliH/SctL family protein, partial [Nitrosomonas sp.]